MNIAIILAGGIGSRVESSNIPKQFVEIGNKPIFIHTVEKFLVIPEIDCIIISCLSEWLTFAEMKIKKNSYDKKIKVCIGGGSRNESISNAISYIQKNFGNQITDDSVILTHDAVRMFLDSHVILENIRLAQIYDVVDTVVPVTDTIVVSENNNEILDIPKRSNFFQGQTPQSTTWKIIKNIYKNQKKSPLYNSTDLCKLALANKNKVYYTQGSYYNFKITTDFDLKLAQLMVEKNDKF